MISTAELAEFVADVEYDELPDDVREAAKRRILDAVGVGLTTQQEGAAVLRRAMVADALVTADAARIWGSPDTAAATRAGMVNAGAVVTGNGPTFLTPTLAPVGASIAPVLAAAEARNATGEETLAGLAAALELHGELAWKTPPDEFHPATHTAVAGAAGVGRTMGFGVDVLEAAIAAAASRVTLATDTTSFDPVAEGTAARSAIDACLLAAGGLDIPDTFTSSNGWHELAGPFDLDLDSGCERVRDAAILPYDGHPTEQSAIEAAIELATTVPLDPAAIDTVTVETVERAVVAIDPHRIATALVDRELSVYRGGRNDVRPIAEATTVRADEAVVEDGGSGFAPARIVVELHNGSEHECTVQQFEGHPSTPASWGTIEEKFRTLGGQVYRGDRLDTIVETVRGFEAESATELARLLD